MAISAPNNTILLTTGVLWTCLTATVGIVAVSALLLIPSESRRSPPKHILSILQVLKEVKVLVWIFVIQNLPEVAFFVYLMYKVRPFFNGLLDKGRVNNTRLDLTLVHP